MLECQARSAESNLKHDFNIWLKEWKSWPYTITLRYMHNWLLSFRFSEPMFNRTWIFLWCKSKVNMSAKCLRDCTFCLVSILSTYFSRLESLLCAALFASVAAWACKQKSQGPWRTISDGWGERGFRAMSTKDQSRICAAIIRWSNCSRSRGSCSESWYCPRFRCCDHQWSFKYFDWKSIDFSRSSCHTLWACIAQRSQIETKSTKLRWCVAVWADLCSETFQE